METVNLNQLPALVKRQIPTAQLPAIYTETKRQLASCVDILVVKDYHDKAMGLAEWARIAKEPDMEEHALRIRLHAKVRIGQLLNEIKPTRPFGQNGGKSGGASGASQAAGLTRTEVTIATRLAASPKALLTRLERCPPKQALTSIWARDTLPIKKGKAAQASHNRGGSDNYRRLVGRHAEMQHFVSRIRNTPASVACGVKVEEAAKLRPMLIEISEWCDAVEHYLPKEKKK